MTADELKSKPNAVLRRTSKEPTKEDIKQRVAKLQSTVCVLVSTHSAPHWQWVAYCCTHARTTTAICIHTSTATFPKSHLISPTHPAAVYIDNDPTLTDDA